MYIFFLSETDLHTRDFVHKSYELEITARDIAIDFSRWPDKKSHVSEYVIFGRNEGLRTRTRSDIEYSDDEFTALHYVHVRVRVVVYCMRM